MTNQEIVHGLKQPSETLDYQRAMTYIWKTFAPTIVKHVTNNNGTREEGNDFFDTVFEELRKAISNGSYNERGKLGGFIQQITHNRWISQLEKRKRVPLDQTKSLDQLSVDEYKELEDDPLAGSKYLKKYGIWVEISQFYRIWDDWQNCDCKKLLILSSEKVKGEEIAPLLAIKRDALYQRLKRCRDELRALLNSNSEK